MDCPFCYNVWKDSGNKVPKDLPLHKLQRLADQLASAHPESVTLTGGEPLCRPDLHRVVELLVKRGIKVGIATNGILLDDARTVELASSGAEWFEISIPAVSRATYREITGTDGAGAMKRALRVAGASGAALSVSHVLTAHNAHETTLAMDLAHAFGAVSFAVNRFVPTGAGSGRRDLFPDQELLSKTLDQILKRALKTAGMKVYAGIPLEPCRFLRGEFPGIGSSGCVCGGKKWALGSDGSLRVCEQSPEILGNLLSKSFQEPTAQPFVSRFREWKRFPKCEDCGLLNSCRGGCRYMSEVEDQS
ncbi:MAG: radical SAM protein [Candidatus Aegiribacteria sp.]|nr:radical SAM protein [Candidatus Aegiribacteria sp.]MBD3294260.1 radical SAM protein [Candidatus Fermentibacteria bacterium]